MATGKMKRTMFHLTRQSDSEKFDVPFDHTDRCSPRQTKIRNSSNERSLRGQEGGEPGGGPGDPLALDCARGDGAHGPGAEDFFPLSLCDRSERASSRKPLSRVSHGAPQNVDVEEETVKCGSLPKPPSDPKHHRIETDWTIWWDKKSRANKDMPYEQNVVELARFQTIEDFWGTFRWLKNVSESPRDTSYHVFRHNVKPMWENFLHGGCIIVKLKKGGEQQIDAYWHTLVAAAIGEYFEEPTLVGVGIGTRAKGES